MGCSKWLRGAGDATNYEKNTKWESILDEQTVDHVKREVDRSNWEEKLRPEEHVLEIGAVDRFDHNSKLHQKQQDDRQNILISTMNSHSHDNELVERRHKLRLWSSGIMLTIGVATLICAGVLRSTALAIVGVALTGLASRIPTKRRRDC